MIVSLNVSHVQIRKQTWHGQSFEIVEKFCYLCDREDRGGALDSVIKRIWSG